VLPACELCMDRVSWQGSELRSGLDSKWPGERLSTYCRDPSSFLCGMECFAAPWGCNEGQCRWHFDLLLVTSKSALFDVLRPCLRLGGDDGQLRRLRLRPLTIVCPSFQVTVELLVTNSHVSRS